MAELQIVSGLNAGETHLLEQRETLLGRHPDCQIVLRDSTVSRRHARIVRDEDGFYLDDVGSQHGTRLNGEVVRFPQRLHDRDEIFLSHTKILFSDADAPAASGERSSTIITSLDVLSSSTGDTDRHEAPKWQALLAITRSLGVSLDLREILPKVLENVFTLINGVTRGCIMLHDRRTGELEVYALHPAPPPNRDFTLPVSTTISERVISEGKALLVSNVGEDPSFAPSESVLELQMHTVLCAPLIGSANEPFGMIHLDAQDPGEQFSSEDLDVLVNVANLVGQAVDHAILHETQLEFVRHERDLETARQVQSHFLPQDRPTITGYEVFDYYNPAEAVGGDYFGYTWLPDGQLAIAVGDVAGHGIPAALLMARLCAEARYCLATDIIASDAVRSLNHELCKQSFSFFITFALCVLDPVRHALTVVNAGHMPPLLRRARSRKVEPIGTDIVSPPLGIDGTLEFRQTVVSLEPGDTVMMYTDGVSEAPSALGKRFGIPRIEETVANASTATEVVCQLLEQVKQFSGQRQEDDICIVAFGRESDQE